MNRQRRTGSWILLVLLLGVIMSPPRVWAGGSDGELKGLVDVPPLGVLGGGTLLLPLPFGAAPVTVDVLLGIPAVRVPVVISPATQIETEEGIAPPVPLTDGDRIEVDFKIVGGNVIAEKLKVENFPEIEARGTVSEVPGGSLPLPLPLGASPVTVTFTLGASGVSLPVVITDGTKVENGGGFVLVNGALVEIEAISLNGQITVTEIELKQ